MELEQLAALAKLRLDSVEQTTLEQEISKMVMFVTVIEQAEEDEPIDKPSCFLRADFPEESLPQTAVLQTAPAMEQGMFLVPKTV